MTLLAIDRSTDVQSVAVAKDGTVTARVLAELDARSPDWPVKIRAFLAENGLSVADLDQVLVGQGPGSFAGIRAALAFAQGLALPTGKPVTGLPSPYAYARDGERTAVLIAADLLGIEGVAFNVALRRRIAAAAPAAYFPGVPEYSRCTRREAEKSITESAPALSCRSERLEMNPFESSASAFRLRSVNVIFSIVEEIH